MPWVGVFSATTDSPVTQRLAMEASKATVVPASSLPLQRKNLNKTQKMPLRPRRKQQQSRQRSMLLLKLSVELPSLPFLRHLSCWKTSFRSLERYSILQKLLLPLQSSKGASKVSKRKVKLNSKFLARNILCPWISPPKSLLKQGHQPRATLPQAQVPQPIVVAIRPEISTKELALVFNL